MSNEPVKLIDRVVGVVRTESNVIRGAVYGGIDYLPLTPVTSIVKITQGGSTFAKGTDYTLTQNGVNWGLGGSQPETGSTYRDWETH